MRSFLSESSSILDRRSFITGTLFTGAVIRWPTKMRPDGLTGRLIEWD